MTAQGHPRTIFNRAVERGDLPAAELAARELGRITLGEALELTMLVAEKDPGGGPGSGFGGCVGYSAKTTT
jgi:hypothetical protein